MATTEKPKSRLEDGRVNPAYTAWRKAAKAAADGQPNSPVCSDPAPDLGGDSLAVPVAVCAPEALTSLMDLAKDLPKSEVGFTEVRIDPDPESIAKIGDYTQVILPPVTEDWTEDFQSAAEPEQTTNDDPREPEVAPALEAPSEVLSLLVIREARNSKFVLCALDKKKVAVRLLKRGTGPKLVKKHIKVRLDRKQYLQVP